ncbi:MAG: hypothetical protein KDD33_02905 [Bdellovibrionales bacterium]|nr:hypothetical protein [Bdellovibrionales bacterium]
MKLSFAICLIFSTHLAHAGSIVNTDENVSSVLLSPEGLIVYVKEKPKQGYIIPRQIVENTGLSLKELSDILLSSKSSCQFDGISGEAGEHRIAVSKVTDLIQAAQ